MLEVMLWYGTVPNGDGGNARHTPHVSIYPLIMSRVFWLNGLHWREQLSGWQMDGCSLQIMRFYHVRRNLRRCYIYIYFFFFFMSHTIKPHNPQRTTIRLPPRRSFPLMQTIQPEGTWCRTMCNGYRGSARHTPHVSIYPPITSHAFWLNGLY